MFLSLDMTNQYRSSIWQLVKDLIFFTVNVPNVSFKELSTLRKRTPGEAGRALTTDLDPITPLARP